jgi:hypothetical protein
MDAAGLAGEREMLEAFLDHYRQVIVTKVRGVSEQDARRRWVPSLTTLGGLVKHLTAAEDQWFQRVLDRPGDAPPPGPAGHVGWDLEAGDTVESLIAGYEAQCARSRATASRFGLADTAWHARRGELSLRWIYLHMIDETARHAGHADILRELTDGSTG